MKYRGILLILVVLVIGGVLAWRVNSHTEKSEVPSTQTPLPTIEVTKEDSMDKRKTYDKAPEMKIDVKKTYTAALVTNKGTMVVQLFASETPVTVNNFVFLARDGYYNNTPFHRIIKGFMIQGGDPTGTGRGGPGYQFNDEPITHEYTRGTIAMANAGPNTNGSQFFIMHADYGLPKNYVIFGSIDKNDAASLKTLDAVATTPVTMSDSGEQSKPTEAVTLTSVSITEK